MARFVVSRLLQAIPTFLIGMAVVVFAIRLVPGDELTRLIGEQVVSPADRAALKSELGLDKSPARQYADSVVGLTHGDFGRGTFDKEPVLKKIQRRLPVTLELTLLAGLFSVLIGVPIGIVCALCRNSAWDYGLRVLGILCLSIPSFWLASMSLVALAIYFDWTPTVTETSFWHDPVANLSQFLLPSLLLGAVLAGTLMRFTRSMMLEVLSEDYVRTARSKGLRHRRVIVGHALRNALIPIVTVIGLQTAALMGGTIVIESVFGLPGIGTLFISALNSRDYPVIQGLNAFLLIVVIAVNLLIDLSYAYLDPRIRHGYGF